MPSVRKSDSHFRVVGAHVDGKSEGTLTVEAPRGDGSVLVGYRPLGNKCVYRLMLGEVCEMIAWRAAKKRVGR